MLNTQSFLPLCWQDKALVCLCFLNITLFPLQANPPVASHSSSASTNSLLSKVVPALVKVVAKGQSPHTPDLDVLSPEQLRAYVSKGSAIRYHTKSHQRQGTGFSIPHHRYGGRLILSNYHVIVPALMLKGRVDVQLPSGKWCQATVIHTDARADLAWLMLPATIHLKPLQWSLKNHPGQKVYAINIRTWPQQQAPDVGRLLHPMYPVPEAHCDHVPYFLQTTLPVQPGYSGGPLINHNGHVLGVCSFGYTPQHTQRSTMAIPSVFVSSVLVSMPKPTAKK